MGFARKVTALFGSFLLEGHRPNALPHARAPSQSSGSSPMDGGGAVTVHLGNKRSQLQPEQGRKKINKYHETVKIERLYTCWTLARKRGHVYDVHKRGRPTCSVTPRGAASSKRLLFDTVCLFETVEPSGAEQHVADKVVSRKKRSRSPRLVAADQLARQGLQE